MAVSKGIGQGGTNEDPAEGKSNSEFRRMFVRESASEAKDGEDGEGKGKEKE